MAANTSVAIPTDRATATAPVARFFVPENRAPDRPGGPELENIANNSVFSEKTDADGARSDRWAARGFLWKESQIPRIRACGRHPITPDGSVQVRSNGAAVGFAGLPSCGSVSACPVCNSKINAVRRLELGVIFSTASAEGMSMAFGAKTLRHNQTHKLSDLWPHMSTLWNAITTDKSTQNLRKELGFVGYTRAAEVTIGLNGWHPHLHPSYIFSKQVSESQIADLQAVENGAWIRKAERLGLQAPLEAAQHLHLVTGDQAAENISEYFTKAGYQSSESVAWEMTSSQTKTGRQYAKTVSSWELLSAARNGDADALDLWHEFEKAAKGKRFLTYSRGLRRRFGLDVEATDEEIAAAEVGTKDDALFEITDWSPVRQDPRLGAGILAAARTGGLTGARRFCADNHIETREVI